MIPRLTAAAKRLRFRHYLLIFVLALFMLLVGLVLKGYIVVPARLAQLLPFLPVTQPTVVAQAQLPLTTPTDQAAIMSGMDQSGMSMADPTSEFTVTPVRSKTIATSTGIVTVITLTPTDALTATVPIPTSTEQVVPEEEQGTVAGTTPTLLAGPTPTLPSTDAQKPTGTPAPVSTVPSPSVEPSAALVKIRIDMQNLDRILHATRVLMKTFAQGQPTAEELAAIRAQLTVVEKRMYGLAAQLQAVQASIAIPLDVTQPPPTATAIPHTNGKTPTEQVQAILIQMQGMLELLQDVLADPATDSTTMSQAQIMLGQLQEMMKQIQPLILSSQTANLPGSTYNTPTLVPTATVTAMPTVTVRPTETSASMTNGELENMMTQMEQLLEQMQSVLESRQDTSGSGSVTPTP